MLCYLMQPNALIIPNVPSVSTTTVLLILRLTRIYNKRAYNTDTHNGIRTVVPVKLVAVMVKVKVPMMINCNNAARVASLCLVLSVRALSQLEAPSTKVLSPSTPAP